MGILDRIIGKSKEERFSKIFNKEVELVCQTVGQLTHAISLFCEGKDFDEKVRQIARLETETDVARRAAEEELYKGAFLPFTRMDRFELIEHLDDVADAAENSVILISMKKVKGAKVLKEDFEKIGSSLAATIDSLRKMLGEFSRDMDGFMKHYDEVKAGRKEIRRLLHETHRKVLSLPMDASDLIILSGLIYRLLKLVDEISEVSDRALAMIVKYQE
jgi:predicted phosphate transport protein (TIGR00153 family)